MNCTASFDQNLAALFSEKGYLVLNNFLPESLCELLIRESELFIKKYAASKFSELESAKNRGLTAEFHYYLAKEKLCLFFNGSASAADCKEKVSKISYTLHERSDAFRKVTKLPDLLTLLSAIGIETPQFLQSMMLIKRPGSQGTLCHQDGSFIYSEPDTTIGLWFALEDAARDNGCLYVIPEAHQTPLKGRLVAKREESLQYRTIDETPWDLSLIKPLEVPRGSLVVLSSLLPHGSFANSSSSPMRAAAFHLIDQKSILPPGNWLNG